MRGLYLDDRDSESSNEEEGAPPTLIQGLCPTLGDSAIKYESVRGNRGIRRKLLDRGKCKWSSGNIFSPEQVGRRRSRANRACGRTQLGPTQKTHRQGRALDGAGPKRGWCGDLEAGSDGKLHLATKARHSGTSPRTRDWTGLQRRDFGQWQPLLPRTGVQPSPDGVEQNHDMGP